MGAANPTTNYGQASKQGHVGGEEMGEGGGRRPKDSQHLGAIVVHKRGGDGRRCVVASDADGLRAADAGQDRERRQL